MGLNWYFSFLLFLQLEILVRLASLAFLLPNYFLLNLSFLSKLNSQVSFLYKSDHSTQVWFPLKNTEFAKWSYDRYIFCKRWSHFLWFTDLNLFNPSHTLSTILPTKKSILTLHIFFACLDMQDPYNFELEIKLLTSFKQDLIIGVLISRKSWVRSCFIWYYNT